MFSSLKVTFVECITFYLQYVGILLAELEAPKISETIFGRLGDPSTPLPMSG